ncbi:O-antigen ligase like membrane protein [Clostridium cavendishii DSM 21758]|uniref:O-antigen ligase like membrane protein n=1 Tax=Clostridium cavendishii DSM 21758 TaxID=1121302 RepID=A0A1M6Q9H8_9CLOT|nr:O-antigen ligase family protein [Clostridium cavendishii]SHK16743.1 O-antigen ligase like membrane protein [Clostridium cavendishii DSM 21758]
MKKININYEILFYILFVITPIIDSINGFLKFYNINTYVSVGQICRMAILGVLFLIFIANIKEVIKESYLPVIIITYFIIMPVFYYMYNQNIGSVMAELVYTTKFIMIILIVEVYKILSKKNIFRHKILENIFWGIGVITVITFIIPFILGVGSNVYSNGAGFKAFYNANNDLSITLVVLFIYFLDIVLKIKKFSTRNIINVILLIAITICNFLIASKTNLVIPIIVTVVYLARIVKNQDINKTKKKYIIISILSILVVIVAFLCMSDVVQKTFDRIIHFWNDLGFASFIFSERNMYLSKTWSQLVTAENFIVKFVFGVGFVFRANYWGRGQLIEMDFFDFVFSYGIVSLVLVYVYFIKIYIKSNNRLGNAKFKYTVQYICVLLFSTFAGHVMFSGLAGTIMGLVACGMINKIRK